MPPTTPWACLGTPPPAALTDARLQAHHALQVVAAVADRLAEPRDDDGHTNAGWDAARRALVGRAVAGGFRAALAVAEPALLVLGPDGDELARLPLHGSTLAEAFAWMGDALRRLASADLPEPLRGREYALPDHAVAAGAPFDTADAEAFAEFARWLADADVLLADLAARTPGASEVRCWPHHFDLASLVTLETGPGGAATRTVGVGLSPGDEGDPAPYLYVSPWPRPDAPPDAPLAGHGRWHTEGWLGAVLTGAALVEAGSAAAQHDRADAFVRSALRALVDRARPRLVWHRVADRGGLAEGRVRTVDAGGRALCLTRFEGAWAALDNRCPHQGGPLGEGSIEGGWLRCPWHGWDFHPRTGKPPGGFDDGVPTFPVEEREDGVYVGVEEEAPHARTVADVMAETLVAWGVRHVWGMVGHSNLGLADALRRREEAGELAYYGIRHEGAASFAASAYGKLTGRPAACLAIAGPGATNLLTGLWDANVDRSPVVALTGQVDTQVLGPGAFQEVDLAAAFGKVAQWSQTVLPTSRHAELVNLACKSALINRGVSHLIVPDEVQTLPAGEGRPAGSPRGRLPLRGVAPPEDALAQALDLLRRARRPVLIVGHGARFEMDAIVALAEALRSPVLTTFKAKGLISDAHPLAGGVLGRSGTPVASWLMNEADLLLVLGASFSNHTGITPKKPIVQVDWDPMALGRFHAVDVPVWGEIGVTVARLREGVAAGVAAIDHAPEIAERQALWRAEKARREADGRGRGVASAAIFAALARQVPDDAILAVDVGNNTYSFGRYFECRRQSVLMSGYLGSIGFALPAALGAWAATQEDDPRFAGRKVVSISGDGGFGQYMGELTTAVKHGMAITHVLLNNAELGKISKEQRAGSWPVWQTSLHNPGFADYARLCGAHGARVTRAEDLDDALRAALAHDGPALVEILADPLLV